MYLSGPGALRGFNILIALIYSSDEIATFVNLEESAEMEGKPDEDKYSRISCRFCASWSVDSFVDKL